VQRRFQVVSGTERTEDCFEMTFGVTTSATSRWCTGFSMSWPTRAIVVVSSGLTTRASTPACPSRAITSAADLAQPRLSRTTVAAATPLQAVQRALHLRARPQARPWRPGRGVNAFRPRPDAGSGLARDYPPLQRLAWRYLLPALRVLPGVRSTRTSGRIWPR